MDENDVPHEAFGPRSHRSAFTIVEVMVSVAILALALAAGAVAIQVSLRGQDSARTTTFVSEILQDEAEQFRLLNWPKIEQLPTFSVIEPPPGFDPDFIATRKLILTRRVEDVSGVQDMKSITFTASWNGLYGGTFNKVLHLRYAREGAYDYYYGIRG
jgi:prepilin-type N-terminal cleavage/methylation domain-containing protein